MKGSIFISSIYHMFRSFSIRHLTYPTPLIVSLELPGQLGVRGWRSGLATLPWATYGFTSKGPSAPIGRSGGCDQHTP
jgi:hypothetical protein